MSAHVPEWQAAARSKFYLLKTAKGAAVAVSQSAQAQIRDLNPAIFAARKQIAELEGAARFHRIADPARHSEALTRARAELESLDGALTLLRAQSIELTSKARDAIALSNSAGNVLVRLRLIRREEI